MLKKTMIGLLAIVITGFIWAILMVVESQVTMLNATDLNIKRSYGGLQVGDTIWGTLSVVGFLYVTYSFFFKIFSKKRYFYLFWIALFAALTNTLIWYILSNTLVMASPSFNDPTYIHELCIAFIAGFILPYTERLISKIAARFD